MAQHLLRVEIITCMCDLGEPGTGVAAKILREDFKVQAGSSMVVLAATL